MSSINEYCSAMSKDGEWGTDIEILAASTILQVPIYTGCHYDLIMSINQNTLKFSPYFIKFYLCQ